MSATDRYAVFTPDTCSPDPGYKLYPFVSICMACRRLHVSCIGDKIVVNTALRRHACIHLYPLVSGYMYLVYCKRGFSFSRFGFYREDRITDRITEADQRYTYATIVGVSRPNYRFCCIMMSLQMKRVYIRLAFTVCILSVCSRRMFSDPQTWHHDTQAVSLMLAHRSLITGHLTTKLSDRMTRRY